MVGTWGYGREERVCKLQPQPLPLLLAPFTVTTVPALSTWSDVGIGTCVVKHCIFWNSEHVANERRRTGDPNEKTKHSSLHQTTSKRTVADWMAIATTQEFSDHRRPPPQFLDGVAC